MNKAFFTALVCWLALCCLPAVPLMTLEYGGGAQVSGDYQCCVLQQSTELLRFYKLVPAENGFSVESFYVNLQAENSAPTSICEYQHPVPFSQDGGDPVFILATGFQGRAYILQKNDLHLFMTVTAEDMQAYTVVTNNPSLTFYANPLSDKTFCFLSPELMILSSQGAVYLLNLQTALCTHYWNFPNSLFMLDFDRVDDNYVIISSYVSGDMRISYLLNYQTMTRTQIPNYFDLATTPLSPDLGNDTFLVRQSYCLDWTNLTHTILMRINANGHPTLYPLYYGGYENSFNYTPMHTFRYVHKLEENRFLAICSDYDMIPNNERLGVFEVQGNSVVYDPAFAELQELSDPSRLYKIQDGYYLSYQSYVPYDQMIRLLDMEAQVTSLPDSNVIISPVKLFSTGNNAFYAVTAGNQVHIYRLVEPSTVNQETQVPPAGLTLSTGPNPFRDAVSFFVSTKKQGWINLSVYDIRGRLLRRFEPIPAKDGSASLEWDGCDSSGKRAAAGIYLLKAEQDGHSAVSKVIRLN